MTVTAIESAQQVLTQWIAVKEQNIEKLIDANNLLLGGISNLHEKQFNQFNSDCNDLFQQYEAAKKVARLKNRNTSAEFNVLRLFEINEPKHSSLLAGLLHPQGHHGQGDLFLHLFLEQLGIEKPKEGHWAVTAEKGRIDILLKRTYPRTLHSAIIIENKSNNAGDQDNQLYRYWYHEIYKPNKDENPFGHKELYSKKSYRIIYLVSNKWKTVADHSLLRPSDQAFRDLPEKVPMEIETWRFQENIQTLIKRALAEIPADNHRLREYLLQYIEYWN